MTAKQNPRTTLTKAKLPNSWQNQLADSISDPAELLRILELDKTLTSATHSACQQFPLRVPRSYVARMEKGNINDPLLQQVLPLAKELDYQPGYLKDPLAESGSNPMPGLIHKYQGRVLLIVSGGCAINCRYCFRRHFPYSENNPGRSEWHKTLNYIRNDSSIHEVILSGGDPLAASDRRLSELVDALATIPHVSTLRVHSRMPVMIPERITSECLHWLTHSRLNSVLVIHCNHPNEIDQPTGRALQQVGQAGVTLLNQSVLLAGVNDQVDTLKALSEQLFSFGVLPYYLHLLDKVEGAAHFAVSTSQGQQLLDSLLKQLPGYLVPKLVRETPNNLSKTPIPPL